MWTCPTCGRAFAARNQTHTCGALSSLDERFAGCAPVVRATFERVLAVLAPCGPVTVLPERSRIALHVRMSFAAFVPRRRWLAGHLVLARHVDSPRLRRVTEYSPRNVVHEFRLAAPEDVDAEFAGWLSEAYDVGVQRHLERHQGRDRRRPPRRSRSR